MKTSRPMFLPLFQYELLNFNIIGAYSKISKLSSISTSVCLVAAWTKRSLNSFPFKPKWLGIHTKSILRPISLTVLTRMYFYYRKTSNKRRVSNKRWIQPRVVRVPAGAAYLPEAKWQETSNIWITWTLITATEQIISEEDQDQDFGNRVSTH